MTRPGLERQGFGALLAGAVLREAEAQGFAAVYVKAERNVAVRWLWAAFRPHPQCVTVSWRLLRPGGPASQPTAKRLPASCFLPSPVY